MMWPFNKQNTQAIITQSRLDETTGKPGSLTIPGVVSIDTKDGHLMGKDSRGNITVIVPLKEISAAVVDEVSNGN